MQEGKDCGWERKKEGHKGKGTRYRAKEVVVGAGRIFAISVTMLAQHVSPGPDPDKTTLSPIPIPIQKITFMLIWLYINVHNHTFIHLRGVCADVLLDGAPHGHHAEQLYG